MKRYKVIDTKNTGFMKKTWDNPLTINELRGEFWGLNTAHTDNFKDFTAEYIQDTWEVKFKEVR